VLPYFFSVCSRVQSTISVISDGRSRRWRQSKDSLIKIVKALKALTEKLAFASKSDLASTEEFGAFTCDVLVRAQNATRTRQNRHKTLCHCHVDAADC
jgi:hypothetical protein